MTDVLIIGSGPAGMTAAIYALRAGLTVRIAEKDYLGTGQIAQTAAVDNYPGMKGISGYDLGEAMRTHAQALGAEFLEGEVVRLHRPYNEIDDVAAALQGRTLRQKNVEWAGQVSMHPQYPRGKDGEETNSCCPVSARSTWAADLDSGETVMARSVIYAAGSRYRTLEVPGEEALFGKRIHFCATCDGAFYAGKTVVVIGGSQMAATDALYLSTLAERVLILYRGTALRAARAEIDAVQARGNIEILYRTVPVSFSEKGDRIVIHIQGSGSAVGYDGADSGMDVAEVMAAPALSGDACKSGITEAADGGFQIEADGVFEAVGMIPQTELIAGLVPLDEGGFVLADETCRTPVEGLFAAGDIRTKPLRQVITACADGANAAGSAEQWLRSESMI